MKEISGSAVKEVHGDAVIGDLFGRKLTGARAARKNDAAVVCSECKQSVLLSEALACCFRAREIKFPKGTTGGQCGTAETNILAKESEGLDTGICRDAVDADVEGENEGRAVADKGKLESAEGCVSAVVSGAALALVRAAFSGIVDELWDTELAHELDKRLAGNGSCRCE